MEIKPTFPEEPLDTNHTESNMNISTEHLKKIFAHHTLDEIFITGYIDNGSSLKDRFEPRCRFGQFHPIWDEIYLEVGQALLRFRTIDAYSKLRMEQVERIECSFDIDPDDTFGLMSTLRTLLPSGRDSVRVTQLDVYTNPNEPLEPGTITALGLVIDQGEYLFFDPQDAVNGIHVGSAQSRERWLAWTNERYTLKSYTVGI